MKAYTVQRLLNHNLVDFIADQRIDLEDSQAEPLLKIGAIAEGYTGTEKAPAKAAPAEIKPESKPPVLAPEDAAVRLAAIKEAIPKLDTENKDLWTGAGKPATAALEAITGWPVSAADRDAAVEALKSAN